MKIAITAIIERQRVSFYIYKKQKFDKHFYIQEAGQISKNKAISVTFFYKKGQTLYFTWFKLIYIQKE